MDDCMHGRLVRGAKSIPEHSLHYRSTGLNLILFVVIRPKAYRSRFLFDSTMPRRYLPILYQ